MSIHKSSLRLLAAGLLACATPSIRAQLTWDADTGTPDVQNGGGTWDLTTANWWDGSQNVLWDNSGSTIAAFGSTASKTGGTVNLSGTLNAGGLVFNPFSNSAGADLPVTSAYTLAGGVIQLADNAVIRAANNSSSGSTGTLFININSVIRGNGIIIERAEETPANAFQYVRFQGVNPDLAGVMTVKSRATNHGIFMLLASSATISGLDRVEVESGSVLAVGGTGNEYAVPLRIEGTGQNNGAIRVDSSNMRFTGGITLTANAMLHTNRNVMNTRVESPVTDAGGGFGFQRTSTSANSVLTLASSSTYSGATTLGRSGGVAGGITVLDFSAPGAPASDMLYHGLAAPGALSMIGGSSGDATFILQGKDFAENRQAFGGMDFAGTRSTLAAAPGYQGFMQVSLGAITRSGTASAAFVSQTPGVYATTSPDGFLGAWAVFVNPAGFGSWAGVEEGVVVPFLGSAAHDDASSLSAAGSTADVRIDAASTGPVTGGTGIFQINTLSMTDTSAARLVDIGAGNVLRVGAAGGIQLVEGARDLVVGDAAAPGALRAGTGTGQLWLANLSSASTMTIHSVIENNSSGSVALYVNGTGRVRLAGANTFTGVAQVSSGILEISHGAALGGTAATTVLAGGSLQLAGGIVTGEPVTINGFGVNGGGALANFSGFNEMTALVTVNNPSRIQSDSGTLLIRSASGTANAVNASGTGNTVAFGGAGDITIRGRFNSGTNAFTKDGAGTLTLAGTNIGTGALTATGGRVLLDFSDEFSPGTNILHNGVTAAALTLNGATVVLKGAPGGDNAQAFGNLSLTNDTGLGVDANGASSVTLTLGTLTRAFGATLALDLPASASIRMNTGVNDGLLTGNGRAFAWIRDPVNGDEWAGTGALSGGTRPLVRLSSLGAYTPSTAGALSGNADIAAGVTTTELLADATVSSLRFAQPQATLITQGETPVMLTAGGILVSSTVGENATTISAGSLRAAPSTVSGNPDLPVIQNNTAAPLIISSAITNSLGATGAAATVSLVKAGPGLLVLNGANTFTGNVRVYEGAIQFTGGSVSSSIEFLLGSGAESGRVILGSAAGVFSPSVDYITTVGTGADNRIVGGSASLSRLTLTGSASIQSTFASGFIGGPGPNENNLELRLASINGVLKLGAANTFRGRVILSRGTIEVEKLADIGQASSLGTGDFNSSAGTITVGDATTSAIGSFATGTIRHMGAQDSETNRSILLTNSSSLAGTITAVTAVLDSAGAGTVKFTTPFTVGGTLAVGRVFHLTGSNTGLNSVAGMGEISAANATSLVKSGHGTWAVTGASLFTGGTSLQAGVLLAMNSTGSATGLGPVNAAAGSTLGGTGIIAPAADVSITLTGATLQIGAETFGVKPVPATLTLVTSGLGAVSLLEGSVVTFDLFSGAGLGDNTALAASADQLIFGGELVLGADATLRVRNPNAMTAWAEGDAWKLFDWTSLGDSEVTGTFEHYDLPALPEGLHWGTGSLYTEGVLMVVVPEPGRALLLSAGLLPLLLRRKRPVTTMIKA